LLKQGLSRDNTRDFRRKEELFAACVKYVLQMRRGDAQGNRVCRLLDFREN